MTRYLILTSAVAVYVTGCCSPALVPRLVPTSTVVRVEPQPTTRHEFRAAEQQGYLVAATGRGAAFDAWDQPIRMYEGQAVHVLSVNARSGEVLACRRDDHKLIRLSPEGVEVEDTTYGR